MAGRPRTAIGTCGAITMRRRDGRAIAETRTRDADGRVRQITVRAKSAAQARSRLKDRLLTRPGFAGGGVLRADSSFVELAELWLADLELRDLTESTKQTLRAPKHAAYGPSAEAIGRVQGTPGPLTRE
jgi:hypothetical protein